MNLLPKKEKEFLKNGLKSRFIIVAAFLFSAAFLAGFVMLLPAYFLVSNDLSETTNNNLLKSKDDNLTKEILDLPNEINLKLNFYQKNINEVSVATYFSKITEYLPAGVRLNSFAFSKNQMVNNKSGTTILVAGVAISRDVLVYFSTVLKDSNLFTSVEVPVSSLTKNKDLPFAINIFIEN